MQTINAIQDELIDEFSFVEDWVDRYTMLIEYGKQLPPFPVELRTQQNLIDGCQSQVWFTAQMQDGRVIYQADSDALLVKGIVALLLQVLNGQTPQDIINAELYFIDKIGLREHLSPTRANVLAAMLKQMKLYALALLNSPASANIG